MKKIIPMWLTKTFLLLVEEEREMLVRKFQQHFYY